VWNFDSLQQKIMQTWLMVSWAIIKNKIMFQLQKYNWKFPVKTHVTNSTFFQCFKGKSHSRMDNKRWDDKQMWLR
jgi:hypothetical protein